MIKHKIFGCLVAASFAFWGCTGENTVESSIEEVDITQRVGPVSQYGQLVAGSPEGVGHIYGACEGVEAGKEVQLRGMSLYWSVLPRALDFYSDVAISSMVRDMKIELIRIAVATTENWGGPTSGFIKDPEGQLAYIKQAVTGAIKNDIYVIIDWHSHTATNQLAEASVFFETVAKEYGNFDNVIFEVFNEPTNQSWADIKSYADSMVTIIRKYSDNLILVGSPTWDQTPSKAIGNEIEDAAHNIAYTFHYYANSHSIGSQGKNAERAMNAGLPIFVSEWGTADADGSGEPKLDRNQQWQDWMNMHKISSANWSASKINEGTAAFLEASTPSSLVFSTSGELVRTYLSLNPDSYTACRK